MSLLYSSTNENLKAIVLGLDLSAEDRVLAVAGSGDQAFAMLEFAKQVKTVDLCPDQLLFVRIRAERLKNGDYEGFLNVDYTCLACGWTPPDIYKKAKQNSREYFSYDRLERIRDNLDNLLITEPRDILEMAQTETGYSKIYLSNAFFYCREYGVINADDKQVLGNIACKMPLNGLIYVANHNLLAKKLGRRKLFRKTFLPRELRVDRKLTRVARKKEPFWFFKPAVYRKVKD